jgi:hypothetical protein
MVKVIFRLIILIMLFPLIASAAIIMGGNTNTSVPYPIVTTNAATSIASTSATLNGTAYNYNSAGTSYFNYGTTSAYGSQTSQSAFIANTSTTAFSASVSNLSFGTTYHFQACASNSAGSSCGVDLTFTTSGAIARLASFSTGLSNSQVIAINPGFTNIYITSQGYYALGVDPSGSYVYDSGQGAVTIYNYRLSDFALVGSNTEAGFGQFKRHLAGALNTFIYNNGAFSSYNFSLIAYGSYVYMGEDIGSSADSVIRCNASWTSGGSCGEVKLTSPTGGAQSGAIDTTNNFLYYVNNNSGTIEKINISGSTFSLVSNSNILSNSVYGPQASTIDIANQFLYTGTQTALDKVNLSTMTRTTSTVFSENSPTVFTYSTRPTGSFASPTPYCAGTTNYIYCIRNMFSGGVFQPSKVTMFRKSDMVELTSSTLTLSAGDTQIISGAIDTTNNLMYLLSYNNNKIIQLSIAP